MLNQIILSIKNDLLYKSLMNFEKVWDKIVFIASIVGLIFLIFISLFRYFILMPSLEKVTNKDEYKPAIKIKKYYK